jgi:hypothetical protein
MELLIKLTTLGEIKRRLDDLPVIEDQVYASTIDRIRHTGDSRGLEILAWLYGGKRTLRATELAYALMRLEPHDTMDTLPDFIVSETVILASCQGLVVALPGSGTFAFSHPTVNEYLEAKTAQNVNIFGFDIERFMAQKCLRHLSLHPPTSGDGKSEFFWYASMHWFRHIRDNTVGEELMNNWSPVMNDQNNCQKNWLEVHRLEGQLSAFQIACKLKIKWLFQLICDQRAGECWIRLEEGMMEVVNLWPEMFNVSLKKCWSEDTKPSDKLALAIAAAGEPDGIRVMRRVISNHSDFRVTKELLLEAAGSSGCDEMLKMLWNHREKWLLERRNDLVSPPPPHTQNSTSLDVPNLTKYIPANH